MSTEKNNTKPKIFIRYPAGTGGLWMSLVLTSLVTPVAVEQYNNGHQYALMDYVNRYHNFRNHYSDLPFLKLFHGLSGTGTKIKTYLEKNFEFYPTPLPFHCAHTHLINTNYVKDVWPETRLLAIKAKVDNIDQLCYNWAIKHGSSLEGQQNINQWIEEVRTKYGKVLDIPEEEQSLHFLTWLCKYATIDFITKFNQVSHPGEVEMNFYWLHTGFLVDHIASIAEGLGIEFDAAGLQRAKNLISRYAETQQRVPWRLRLEDYS